MPENWEYHIQFENCLIQIMNLEDLIKKIR